MTFERTIFGIILSTFVQKVEIPCTKTKLETTQFVNPQMKKMHSHLAARAHVSDGLSTMGHQ
jgi:hypothetical protein